MKPFLFILILQESNKPIIRSPGYIPFIDGLRFVGFILIFFRHYHGPTPAGFLTKIGWVGVPLFFLISGFLLTKLLCKEYQAIGTINLKKYFARRILRIWPLYFTYLFIIFIIAALIHKEMHIQRLAGNIFFYDNFLSAFYGYNQNWISGHLWSISMEEQYYLILPFLIPFLFKLNPAKRIKVIFCFFILLALAKMICLFSNYKHPFIYVMPISGEPFLAGILLGFGQVDNIIRKINPYIIFIIGVLMLLFVYLLPSARIAGWHQLLIYLFTAAGFSFIVLFLINGRQTLMHLLLTNKIVTYLGKISFGLYVFHVGCLEYIQQWFGTSLYKLGVFSFLPALILTVALSVVSYELWEKRFLRLKTRYSTIKEIETSS